MVTTKCKFVVPAAMAYTGRPPVVGDSCASGVKSPTRRGTLPPPGAGCSCAPGDKSATRGGGAGGTCDEWKRVKFRRPLINMREITKLGSLNVRTLNSQWRQGELTAAAEQMGIVALGIQNLRLQCTEDVRHVDMGGG